MKLEVSITSGFFNLMLIPMILAVLSVTLHGSSPLPAIIIPNSSSARLDGMMDVDPGFDSAG